MLDTDRRTRARELGRDSQRWTFSSADDEAEKKKKEQRLMMMFLNRRRRKIKLLERRQGFGESGQRGLNDEGTGDQK